MIYPHVPESALFKKAHVLASGRVGGSHATAQKPFHLHPPLPHVPNLIHSCPGLHHLSKAHLPTNSQPNPADWSVSVLKPQEYPAVQVGKAEAITVEAMEYNSCMSIIESDHKPVWTRLGVTLPVTLQERHRRKCSHLLKDCFLHSMPEPPNVRLSTDLITLHPVTPFPLLKPPDLPSPVVSTTPPPPFSMPQRVTEIYCCSNVTPTLLSPVEQQ